jgi:hypothetical protein
MPVLGAGHLIQAGTIPLGTMKNLIWNNTLYTQEGYTVRAYDISPGVALSKIGPNSYAGQVAFPRIVTGLYVKDNTMYVVTSNSFHTVDISDKLHPTFLGNASRLMKAKDVVAENGYAYIAGGSGIYVYDISDLSSPTYLKTVSAPYLDSCRIISDGNYLYSTYQETSPSISIWNIAVPGSPTLVKNFNYNTGTDMYWAKGLSYRNNTVYISHYYRELITLDVTNRSNPVVLNRIFGWHVDNTISGEWLFTSRRYANDDGSGSFAILRIGANNIPKYYALYAPSLGYSEGISTNGNVTAISRWTGGITLFNTTKKSSVTKYTNINIPGEIFKLSATTVGNMDVLAAGGRNIGSWYFNITDPSDMNKVGYGNSAAFSPGNPRTFNIPWVGNYSYIEGDGNMGGAWIINMTNIGRPGFANQNPPNLVFNKADNVESINAFDKWIFTESQYGWFRIWNNSRKDKATPTQVFAAKDAAFIEYSGDGHMWFQYNESDNLYLTNYHGMVTIINTAVPSAPTKIVPNATRNPHWLGRIVYNPTNKIVYGVWKNEAQNQYYISQVDVSDINNIHETGGSIQVTDSQTRDIACNGTDVFVVGRVGANVRMYSFDNPSAPRLVDSAYTMEGDAEAVEYYKGYLYTAYENVLTVYKVIPSSSKVIPAVTKVIPTRPTP